MPYRALDNNWFRPAGAEEFAHFNAYIGDKIIKVIPFDNKIEDIQYLAMNTQNSSGIKLSKDALKQANIGKWGYIEIIDGATYIMAEEFRGDPLAIAFPSLPPFAYTPTAGEFFFEEAAKATLTPLTYSSNKVVIPKVLCSKLDRWNPAFATVSLYSMHGAQWAEIRPGDSAITRNISRFDSDIMYDGISGVTFTAKLYGGRAIGPSFIRIGREKDAALYAWYSETRNAIIAEKAPEYCAVCGTSIRWTERGHYHRHLSANSNKYMGAGNGIHTLVKAEQALSKAKRLL